MLWKHPRKQYKKCEALGSNQFFGKLISLTYTLCRPKITNNRIGKVIGLASQKGQICFDDIYTNSFWELILEIGTNVLATQLLMRILCMDCNRSFSEFFSGIVFFLLTHVNPQREIIHKFQVFFDAGSDSFFNSVICRFNVE